MRTPTQKRLWRHPVCVSALATLSVLIGAAVIRLTTATVHGGGAYIETAEMSPQGVPSTGDYLALTYREDAGIANIGELLRRAVGLDIEGDPRVPDEYDTVATVSQTELSRQIGGKADIDQAADAAWAAAHWIADIRLQGVSSVLNITSIDESAMIVREHGVAVGDRIVSVNGEPASAMAWNRHVERGFDIFNESRTYGRDVELTVATATGSETFTVPVMVNAYRDTQGYMNEGDIELIGSIGLEVNEITLLTSERPNLVVPPRVTGPSAGIVHTLVYLDNLTDGDLTGGLRIAATGIVNSIGRVEQIGGAHYKASAAVASGADVLFVPIANRDDVDSFSDQVTIVSVSSVSDAVRWLCANGGESTACYTTWLKGPAVGIPDGYDHLRVDLERRAAKQADVIKINGPR